MAYIKRIVDDRIFEVFGTKIVESSLQIAATRFLIYDAEFGSWMWERAEGYEPLEELVPDDDMFEEDEKEDKL